MKLNLASNLPGLNTDEGLELDKVVYWEVGFANLSHFSDSFKEYFGYNPNEAKRQSQQL
ncbi:helix-turn-helix domain-containing protein [Mucilaginibacter sp. X5P1]|uniref:helix-turn-helix domain-containing protein n=1 Tax=Mucilaginibacter sp. X5P1 TaxID=2723088 RepID=UPI001614E08F|nr:hypothetical protein [Mucilaginibacter sp. X5P1]MBB6139354.1 transcriptional regulator GlxA family with amidase domain [Mucilaginibacter sp. X5P1]